MKEFFSENKLLLAPMAGVTDIALRSLSNEFGASMTFTEMVSAKALSYANDKTRHLLDLADGEEKVAVQMFGHEADVMAAQAAWIEESMGEHLAWIDINMGCPARKIVTKGEGSALMKTPELAAEMVSSVRRAVSCPVTAKFRRGWAMDDETAPEFAKRMEDAGADAVTVHGRYALQLYRGDADWGVIERVKDAVSIPVVGNGEIKCGLDAARMLDETGCDAVMIARGAQGNPWIFAEAQAAIAGDPIPARPTVEEKLAMAHRHAELLTHREGRNIVRMRKHAMWYMAGVPKASEARGKINFCVTLEDFDEVFAEVLETARRYKEAGFYFNPAGL